MRFLGASRWLRRGAACVATCAALLVLNGVAASSARAGAPPWGNGVSRGEDLSIALVTFGPGDDIPTWFGHTALRVEDRRLKRTRLYNYGMFNFGRRMLPNFLKGRLRFWVGTSSWPGALGLYRRTNRDIRVQELNLSAERKLRLAAALAENVLPENRYYLYHHYDDNCSTRVRDMIDRAVDGQLRSASSGEARMTLREHTRRHAQHSPAIDLVLNIWLNDEVDREIMVWDEMFLPSELEQRVQQLSYIDDTGQSVRLVAHRSIVYLARNRDPVPDRPPLTWPWTLLLGIQVAALGAASCSWVAQQRKRRARAALGLFEALFGLTIGLPGLLLMAMALFTEHTVTYGNEALWLTNPLTLLLFPLGLLRATGWQRPARWLRIIWMSLATLTLAGLLLKLLPSCNQDILLPATLIAPVNLLMAWSAFRHRTQIEPAA